VCEKATFHPSVGRIPALMPYDAPIPSSIFGHLILQCKPSGLFVNACDANVPSGYRFPAVLRIRFVPRPLPSVRFRAEEFFLFRVDPRWNQVLTAVTIALLEMLYLDNLRSLVFF